MSDRVTVGDLNSNARGSGARKNGGKVDFSLVPLHLLAGVARIMAGGTIKYNAYNWCSGMKYSVCFACTMRHLFKWFYLHEENDYESGESHLSHAIANILFLIHYSQNYTEGDDRPPESAMFSGEDFDIKFDEDAYRERNQF